LWQPGFSVHVSAHDAHESTAESVRLARRHFFDASNDRRAAECNSISRPATRFAVIPPTAGKEPAMLFTNLLRTLEILAAAIRHRPRALTHLC
jgi:hypothetical protein